MKSAAKRRRCQGGRLKKSQRENGVAVSTCIGEQEQKEV